MGIVADRLETKRRRFALAGAMALHARGISRSTQDLDIVTEATAQAELIAHLESLGYETLHRSDGYSNHLHSDPALGRLDFIYVDALTADALFAECDKTYAMGGRRIPVPSAEHLVAMKVQAMKNDPRRAFKELADIQSLIQTQRLDTPALRRYFERAGLLERFRELEKSL
jgi:hypothetical protein